MSESPTPTDKRPILRTAQEAYRVVLSNFRLFLIAAAVPFALSALIELPHWIWIFPHWFAINWWDKLHYLPYAILGVAWCRFVLLGHEVATPTILPHWHPRLGRFILFLIPTLLIFSLISLHGPIALYEAYTTFILNIPMDDKSFHTIGYRILWSLTWISSIYFLLRFSLLFPALAIDKKSTFSASWKLTRGVSFRLLAAFILCFIPFYLVEIIAYDVVIFLSNGQSVIISLIHDYLYGSIWSMRAPLDGIEFWGLRATTLVQGIVILILDYLWVGLIASMISIAFRICTGWVPGVGGRPPAISEEPGGG